MKRYLFLLFFISFLFEIGIPKFIQAQGMLIQSEVSMKVEALRMPRPIIITPPHPFPPQPPVSPRTLEYKISKIDVQAKLVDQIAEVQVSQSFVNTGSTQMEVSFVFPLPYEGAIDQLTLMVDGKEFPAALMPAEKARSMYEEIVRKNKDPALLEWIGTGMFRTSVFPVPAGATRTVTLKYTQLCRLSGGLTDFLFPLSTAKYTTKPVEKIMVNVLIESTDPIRNVYSPTQEIKIEKPSEKSAKISWEASHCIPSSDFRLLYDVGTEKLSTKMISYRPKTEEEGYFLLLASPAIKKTEEKPLPKTVFFVMDNSGSMSGKKIKQAKEALKFVLNNLRAGDTFNIMVYNSTIQLFKEEMQIFTDETRREGLVFTEGIYSGGGTNINTALTKTLEILAKSNDKNPKYIFFLTDGCPTVGECNEIKITENAHQANTIKARIFAFGVGYDLNSRLLDKLVRKSSGQSEYVQPNENIEERISRLYEKLSAPVMTDVQLVFSPEENSQTTKNDTPLVNRVYPASGFDIFAEDQLIISGRYKYPGKGTLKISGKIADGVTQEFSYPLEFTAESLDSRFSFAEKMWAIRRIGELIDELDLNGKNQEILDELLQLSIKHGILTPYTSFLADENASLTDQTANFSRLGQRVEALGMNTSGEVGVQLRAVKGKMQNASNIMDAGSMADTKEMEVSLQGVIAADTISQQESAQPITEKYRPSKIGRTNFDRNYGGIRASAQASGPAVQDKTNIVADLSRKEQLSVKQNVRVIENRAFFFKNNQWNDTTLTETQQKIVPRKVRQFSNEYFDLVKKYEKEITPFLIFEEPVLLNIKDEVILIEP
ncbi:MAG: VIT domain-containing protein [Planctomycetia bacterium]|nr:VIT domain-containing protein [Planctomycetia bacterium]